MSIRRLVFALTFLAVFAMAARISVDTDTWWHLRAGRWILENGQVPQEDPFSYTRAGEKWQYPGWLIQVPLYGIHQAFGPGGLNLWTAAMVTLAFIFVWPTLSGGPFLRAFVVVLAAATSGVYWAARPYMVTFVLAAVYLWILEDHRWGRANRLWLLPVLMVLWANSHGGFAVGFILLGAYGVGALRFSYLQPKSFNLKGVFSASFRRLVGMGVLMLVAVALNPSGPVMLLYPFKTVSIGVLQEFIQEWQSPDFHSLQVQPFLWLIFLTLAAIGTSGRRLALVDFLLFTGLAYMGFLAGRNVALFALAAPMVLTRHADPALLRLREALGFPAPAPRRQALPRFLRRINVVLLVLLFLAAAVKAATVVPRAPNRAYFQEFLPVEAVSFLTETNPEGRLFNSYNWGGYLLWHLPQYPVFVDGRTDLYDDEILETWLQTVRAEGDWRGVLDRWGINLVLVEPQMPLVRALESNGWELVHEDEVAVVYRRTP